MTGHTLLPTFGFCALFCNMRMVFPRPGHLEAQHEFEPTTIIRRGD